MNDLFLVEDEAARAKLERCAKVRVKRLELGKWVYCPIAYTPETLETLEQLHEIFGGGDYTLEARDTDNHFLHNIRLQLPGKPKPLMPEPEPPPAAPAVAASPVQSESAFVMQMVMAQMQQTTQILTAVLSRGDNSSDKILARSQQLEDRARTEHNEFLKAILGRAEQQAAAQPTVGGSKESFLEGIEFAQGLFSEMMNKQGAAENPADFMTSMNQFLQGLAAIGREVSTTGVPAGVPPAAPNGAS
jgi:hypothetical protein